MRDQYGGLYAGWGTSSRKAKQDASKACDEENVLPCLNIDTYWTEKYRARGQKTTTETRQLYAALAWLRMSQGNDRRAWIASGHANGDAAKAAVVAACKAANGRRECVATPAVGNGFIQTCHAPSKGAAGDGQAVETTLYRARKAALAQCTKGKVTCALQQTFDSRVSGLFVHDFTTGISPGTNAGAPR